MRNVSAPLPVCPKQTGFPIVNGATSRHKAPDARWSRLTLGERANHLTFNNLQAVGSNCQDTARAYAYSTYGSYQCYGALVALIAILQYPCSDYNIGLCHIEINILAQD